jgi:hypothetical protein
VVERGQQVNEHPPGWKTSGLKGGESAGQEDGTAETHRDGDVDGENEFHTHERSTPLSKTDFPLMVGNVSALERRGRALRTVQVRCNLREYVRKVNLFVRGFS